MSDLTLPPQDSLYLYNTYRGAADKRYPHAAGVFNSLEDFRRAFDKQSLKTILVSHMIGKPRLEIGIAGFADMILPLYKEGIALARIFGSEEVLSRMPEPLAEELRAIGSRIDRGWEKGWNEHDRLFDPNTPAEDEFDDIAGKMFAYQCMEIVRTQSGLKYLHALGKITDEAYNKSMAVIELQMDRIGINGIHRMIEVRPELEEILASDKRRMPITNDLLDGVLDSEHQNHGHTEYSDELFTSQEMPRGRYYTLMRDNVCTTPYARKKLIQNMMGKDYAMAYNERMEAFAPFEMRGKTDAQLDISAENLIAKIKNRSSEEEYDKALRIFLINYGLGLDHEKLEELQRAAERTGDSASPTKLGNEAPGDDPQKKILEAGSSEPATRSEDERDTSSTGLPDTRLPPSRRRTNARKAESDRDTGDSAFPGSLRDDEGPGDNSPSFPKHKNFVTAGKIGATTVLGVGLVDGVYNMFKSTEKDEHGEEKPVSKSKRFIRAVEAAAAITGIVILWKSKAVHGWMNNLFNRGPQSA